MRAPTLLNHVPAGSPLLARTAAELGLPPWDIPIVRCGARAAGVELDGDRELVLGALAEEAS